jgi:hypothetical protein
MFAPPVAKTGSIQPQRSAVAAERSNQGAVTQGQLLQRTIGHQAPPRFQAQRASVTPNALGAHESECGAARIAARETAPWWDFNKIPIHSLDCAERFQIPCLDPTRRLPIQTKLEVGQADDLAEQEADRIADQVMRMPEPGLPVTASAPRLGPQCAECDQEERLRRKSTGQLAVVGEVPEIIHEVLSSPGQPLDAATRAYFEPRFGHDFSHVRIHSYEQAARSAKAIRARAYTAGSNIVFAGSQFSPATSAGRTLLAHELAHVTQQTGARDFDAVRSADERHRVPSAPPITGTVARQPDPSPPPDLGWSDASAKGLKGLNKGPTTVDASGKILTGKIESVTSEGVWRVPVEGLRKDKKGRAIALIPNTVNPTAPDKDSSVRVDVLLHLHGWGAGYRELKSGESDYAGVLKPGELRDVDLYQMEQQLLSHVKTSKQLLIAVLPQGSDWSNFGDLSSQQRRLLKRGVRQTCPNILAQRRNSGPRDCVGT